jgi:hypothetical protein
MELSNKGQRHIFLGDSFSDALDKTTVEPGNVFSPGMWTFGIFNFAKGPDAAQGTDAVCDFESADSHRWYFDEGARPIVGADYGTEGSFHVKNRLFNLGSEGCCGVDFFEAEASSVSQDGWRYVVAIDEEGPAGGKIGKMRKTDLGLEVNSVQIVFETQPDALEIEDTQAFAYFNLSEKPRTIRFRAIHAFTERNFGDYPRTNGYDTFSFVEAQKAALEKWRVFQTEIICPDARINSTYGNCLFHMLNIMESGLPRKQRGRFFCFLVLGAKKE